MEANEADERWPRSQLIETCPFISFFYENENCDAEYSFKLGTFFDSAAQERLFIWRNKMADLQRTW